MCRSPIIFLLIMLCIPAFLIAQDEDVNLKDKQLWFDYYHYYYFKPQWMYYGDAGYRILVPNAEWQMVYIRPSVRWKPKDLYDVRTGIGFFETIYKDSTNTLEIRPWQGFRLNWPSFKRVTFYEFFRLEQRFVFPQDTWKMEFNLRFRIKLGAKAPLYHFPNAGSIFALTAVEWFIDVGQQITELFTNRSRIELGAGYKMNSYWTFEFQYVWQRSRTGENDALKTSDNLIQFKARYYFYSLDYRSKIASD